MQAEFDTQVDKLAHRTRQYLLSHLGRMVGEANDEELYRALVHAIRAEIMIAYLATERTIAKQDARRLYYLSMEYLPGRFFINNMHNIGSLELIKSVLQKLSRTLPNITAQESEPGLGNGGLGRLASCLLDSLASLHYPAFAYGLRYQYGIFEQQMRAGVQVEVPDCWLLNENPWEIRQELQKVTVKYGGRAITIKNFHGDPVQTLQEGDEVWAMPYDIPIVGYKADSGCSVLTLRLWSTKESPRNFQLQRYNAGNIDQAAENMLISDVLYPNELNDTGKRIRLKQEFLLVSASVQDILQRYLATHDSFAHLPDKVRIQTNDTHPALVIAELTRVLNKTHNVPWKLAVEMTQNITSYTNHTILKEALEEWDQSLVKQLLPRQYRIIEQINHDFCDQVRKKHPNNEALVQKMSILEGGKVRMANLSIVGSHKVNGVSKIHSELLKHAVFKDFYELWPDRFVNVTNGVTQRLWLAQCNPGLSAFISHRIGDGWITDFTKIAQLAPFAECPDSRREFWEIRHKNKDRFIDFLRHNNRIRDAHGKIVSRPFFIENDALFDVQIKRFHEYKRQLMNALHLLMLYHDILDDPQAHGRIKRCVLFAGKTAAGYETAKQIMRLIFAIMRKINHDPNVRRIIQVVFVENYNVSKAELIIPAADISEQISLAGTEASGTSVMKFAMNGALTIGTHDGANIEINNAVTDEWWPFRFGCTAEEVAKMRSRYQPREVLARNKKIARAVEELQNHSLAINDEEHQAFCKLLGKLLDGQEADKYFVLHDLESYYDAQRRVEALFKQPDAWAKYAIRTISAMGNFSTDHCIHQYSQTIWGLTPCPPEKAIIEQVRDEYSSE